MAEQAKSAQPVETIITDVPGEKPAPGIALCLSGGGYRAMLFHLGTLWRLYEVGYLPRLSRVSSVSGGSITAAVLAMNWTKLPRTSSGSDEPFVQHIVGPIRHLAGETIDEGAILKGILLPGTIAERIADAYRTHLFGRTTLQDLPDEPRFVFNATNVQSGALWRFSKPYMADYRVGRINHPELDLAVAVGASSAFPPVLSPACIILDSGQYEPPQPGEDLHREPFTTHVVLTDGGVYDNLGLETAWKRYDTILVSDGGGKMAPDPAPHGDWARHALRVNDLIDNQVRSLRKRQLIDAFKRGDRRGAYWGIRTNIANYQLPITLPCPSAQTLELAETPTRLKALGDPTQERLINWGYAITDAALRRHVEPTLTAPSDFPYPEANI